MKLNEWLTNNFTRIAFTDESCDNNNGITLKRHDTLNRKLTIALLSTDNIQDYRNLVFSYSPVGTIREDIDEEWYNVKLLQLRAALTHMMINETNTKVADRYLKILERRDRNVWAEKKEKSELSVKSNDLNVTFSIKE